MIAIDDIHNTSIRIVGDQDIGANGYLLPGRRLRAPAADAKDFAAQPFDLDEVLVRLRNMMEVQLKHMAAEKFIKSLEQEIVEEESGRDHIRSPSGEANSLLMMSSLK